MTMMMMITVLILNTDNDIKGGAWLIGADPAANSGFVWTEVHGGDLWPQQVKAWKYWTGDEWLSDPLLTVTGNINIL